MSRSDAGRRRAACRTGWALGVVMLTAATVLHGPAAASVRSEALYARGLVPFDNGQWEQAYRLFDQAVQADRTDALAWYYRGLTQARRGLRAAAIQDFEQALKLKPTLARAPLDLGIAYFDEGKYDAAKIWLERAYQRGIDRFTAAFFLGLTCYRLGDDAAAATYLNEAKADPDLRPSAEYYAGLALLRQGKQEAGRSEIAQTAREGADSEIGKVAQRYTASGEARQPPAAVSGARAKPWSLYAGLGFEYDSNVVLAPSDSAVKAAEGISGKADGRAVFAAGGDYTLLDTDLGSLRAEYDFYQSIHFRLTEFDLQGHRVRLSAASRPGVVTYGLTGTYDFYALDYQTFFQEGLGTPWVAFAEGTGAATQAYYTVRGRDFFRAPYDPSRDAIDHAVGLRQYLALGSLDRVLTIGYQFDSEDPQAHGRSGQPVICTPTIQTSGCGARDFEYNGNQADIDLALPWPKVAFVQLGYLIRFEDYQFPNSRAAYQVRRHDNTHQFVVSLGRELIHNLTLNLSYIGVLNNSNVAAYDYDRNIVASSLVVTF